MRTDLGMDTGKMCSQVGHAYLGSFLSADIATQKAYHSDFPTHPGTKVCLACKNIDQLNRALYEAQQSGIPSYLVTDSGCKNFFVLSLQSISLYAEGESFEPVSS